MADVNPRDESHAFKIGDAGLFGFMEHGYRPVIVLAIGADAIAVVALSAVLAWADGRPQAA
jgi:hypothetical protein